jgi:cell division inhibitor SepF
MFNGLAKVKSFLGMEELEDYDEEIMQEAKGSEERSEYNPAARQVPSLSVRHGGYTKPSQSPAMERRNAMGNTVDERGGALKRSEVSVLKRPTGELNIIAVEPKSFDHCPILVDKLKSQKPVIINFERLESKLQSKIFDFMSGATYALSGTVKKISNYIFVFSPANVKISFMSEEEEPPKSQKAQGW